MDSNESHRRWDRRTGEYSPSYYADFGPGDTSDWIHQVVDSLVDSDAAVLELGCSAGRHLAYLHEHGYENLYGIDINEDAREAMETTFPELAADGTFYFDAIENVVSEFDAGQFDVVYSVETLQLIPPENTGVFDELARITDDVLVTVENEGDYDDKIVLPTEVSTEVVDDFPIYHRTWNQIFTERGFAEVDSMSVDMDTFRVFRKVDGARSA